MSILARGISGALIRSPSGNFTGNRSTGYRAPVWGWRFRHIVHMIWDLQSINNYIAPTYQVEPITYRPADNSGVLGSPAGENQDSEVVAFGMIAVANEINNIRLQAELPARTTGGDPSHGIRYLKHNYELQKFIYPSVEEDDQDPYRKQYTSDNSFGEPTSNALITHIVLSQVTQDTGIEIGGIDPGTGLRAWSNCKADNTIEYKRQMTSSHIIAQKTNILTNAEIALDEIEIVLRHHKYLPFPLEGGSYFGRSSGHTNVYDRCETPEKAWLYTNILTNSESANFFYWAGGDIYEVIFLNSGWYATMSSSYKGIPNPGIDYRAIGMKTNDSVYPTPCLEGEIAVRHRWYDRDVILRLAGQALDLYDTIPSYVDEYEFNVYGMPFDKEKWTQLATSTDPYFIDYMLSDPTMPSPSPAEYKFRAEGSRLLFSVLALIRFTAMKALGYGQKNHGSCWFCNTSFIGIKFSSGAYWGVYRSFYITKPYGYTGWATEEATYTHEIVSRNNSSGTLEIVGYVNGSGSLGTGIFAVSPSSPRPFTFQTTTGLPTSNSTPSTYSGCIMEFKTSNDYYLPGTSSSYMRHYLVVQATVLSFSGTTINRNVSNPISNNTVTVTSSTNYGRINYTITNKVGTFFNVDKASDDVAYTGATISSTLTISYNTLTPGTYTGSFRITCTGASISYQLVTIRLVVT